MEALIVSRVWRSDADLWPTIAESLFDTPIGVTAILVTAFLLYRRVVELAPTDFLDRLGVPPSDLRNAWRNAPGTGPFDALATAHRRDPWSTRCRLAALRRASRRRGR